VINGLGPLGRLNRALAAVAAVAVIGACAGDAQTDGQSGPAATPGSDRTARVSAMAFFPEGRGWVVTDDGVFRTTDNGSTWLDATPPVAAQGFFFRDPATAWALRFGDAAGDRATAVVLATRNGGVRWDQHTVSLAFDGAAPGGAGSVFVIDQATGWLLGQAQTSSAASKGVLYRTADGGASWTKVTTPIAGTLRFATATDGWVAGGAAGGELYVTRDGGATWTPVAVPHRSPSQPWLTTVAAPIVVGRQAAVLPIQVRLSTTADQSDLYFLVTSDTGRTWTAAGPPLRTDQGGSVFEGSTERLSVVTANHWFLLANGLWTTRDAGRSWHQVTSDRDLRYGVRISFTSPSIGWLYAEQTTCQAPKVNCTTKSSLLRTTDGGHTWAEIIVR